MSKEQKDTASSAAKIVESIVLINGRRAGDYAVIIKATAGDDGTTHTWDWWWRPPGLKGVEGAGT